MYLIEKLKMFVGKLLCADDHSAFKVVMASFKVCMASFRF